MFTLREKEIMDLVVKGLTNIEIASNLTVSRHTVKAHLEHIYSKLGVHNRLQAVLKYLGMKPKMNTHEWVENINANTTNNKVDISLPLLQFLFNC